MSNNLENNPCQLDLQDCVSDCTDNLIYDNADYSYLSDEELTAFVLEAIQKIIEDFATDPQKFIKADLQKRINQAIADQKAASDANSQILGIDEIYSASF